MLNGVHTTNHRASYGLGPMCMRCDGKSIVVCRGDYCLDFFKGHLRIVSATALIQHTTRRHNLDEIVAELVVQAHRLDCVVYTVDDALDYTRITSQIRAVAVGRICVAAG